MVDLIACALAGMRQETGASLDGEWPVFFREAPLILDILSACPELRQLGRVVSPVPPSGGLPLPANDR